jgi:hypothetical protein
MKINKLIYVVHDILAEDEEARNSDARLICLVWLNLHAGHIHSVEVKGEPRPKQCVTLKDIVSVLESPETIRRTRQKIQNDLGLYPPTLLKVIKGRRFKEEEIRESVRNNFTKEQTKAILEIYMLAKNKSKVDVGKIKREVILKYGL